MFRPIILLVSAFFILTTNLHAQRTGKIDPRRRPKDIRTKWEFDSDRSRYISKADKGRWAEYRKGRLYRIYQEANRTDDYIEMSTSTPQPSVIRIYNRQILWKLPRESRWRRGDTGGWIEPKDPRDPRVPRRP